MNAISVAIGTGIVIVITDVMLWRFFRRKINGLVFPREMDASLFRVFSLKRMRVFVVLHALVLMAACFLLIYLFW